MFRSNIHSGVLEPAGAIWTKAIVYIASQLCAQWHHRVRLKSATVGIFTLKKMAKATNQGSPQPPGEPVIKRCKAHTKQRADRYQMGGQQVGGKIRRNPTGPQQTARESAF